jgi:predicted flap endonuclease-1-like 5' DNA nuclease
MFTEWEFLLAEIWVLLALAALIGLIAGWLIWGGRAAVGRGLGSDMGPDANEVRRLRIELDRAKAQSRDPLDDIPAMQGGGYVRPGRAREKEATLPVSTPDPIADMPSAQMPMDDVVLAVPAAQPTAPQSTPVPNGKPQGLSVARDGLPDDLKEIIGIGAKIETICNRLGIWHYDQIAAWSADEIAWVDDNLEMFKGRVTRDIWVAQAKELAGNPTPAFLRRKD